MKKVFDMMRYNYIQMNRKGSEVFKMPLGLFFVLFLLGFKTLCILMVVSLFFDFTFSFTGKDDMTTVNTFMDKVNRIVMQVKEQF